jgi:hypothetical protein
MVFDITNYYKIFSPYFTNCTTSYHLSKLEQINIAIQKISQNTIGELLKSVNPMEKGQFLEHIFTVLADQEVIKILTKQTENQFDGTFLLNQSFLNPLEEKEWNILRNASLPDGVTKSLVDEIYSIRKLKLTISQVDEMLLSWPNDTFFLYYSKNKTEFGNQFNLCFAKKKNNDISHFNINLQNIKDLVLSLPALKVFRYCFCLQNCMNKIFKTNLVQTFNAYLQKLQHTLKEIDNSLLSEMVKKFDFLPTAIEMHSYDKATVNQYLNHKLTGTGILYYDLQQGDLRLAINGGATIMHRRLSRYDSDDVALAIELLTKQPIQKIVE